MSGCVHRDAQQVAAGVGLERPVVEQPPDAGDHRLDGVRRAVGRVESEERLHEALPGHDLVRVQREQDEQRPLTLPGEAHRASVLPELERTEQSELQPRRIRDRRHRPIIRRPQAPVTDRR